MESVKTQLLVFAISLSLRTLSNLNQVHSYYIQITSCLIVLISHLSY